MKMAKQGLPALLCLLIAGSSCFVSLGLQADGESDLESIGKDLLKGIDYRIVALGYGFYQDIVEESSRNPNNMLALSTKQAEGQIRLDLSYKDQNFFFMIKPRLDWSWEKWTSGKLEGEASSGTDGYLYEWMVRVGVNKNLFASYGLENLQWGPSYLVSPSNPFINNNGKNNPFLEVPGLEYGRLSWAADASWMVQAFANVGDGRLKTVDPFKNTYAGKIDYVGDGHYGSLILSQRNSGPVSLGGYAGMTISDALLTHVEATVDAEGKGAALIGGSYTFSDGSSLVLEFYHNGVGCITSQVRNCYIPYGDNEFEDILVRSNYGFIQYFKNEFFVRQLDLTLRGTFNLEDESRLLTGIAGYDYNDHVELFAVLDYNSGGNEDELSSLINYSVMAGLMVTY